MNVKEFIKADKSFAFAAHDGNSRYAMFMAYSDDKIANDIGMEAAAVQAARNALSASPIDYSNGAFFGMGLTSKATTTSTQKCVPASTLPPPHIISTVSRAKRCPAKNGGKILRTRKLRYEAIGVTSLNLPRPMAERFSGNITQIS